MRASLAILVALVGASSPCSAQPKSGTQREPVVRAPFVLKLRIDKGHFYEERFGKVPYVAGDDVYLFAGDSFGINIISAHGRIPRISYQPDPARADLEFSFSQQRGAGGFEMMLVIQNKLKCKLYLDALMTVPGKKGVYETDTLPVPPNLSEYERLTAVAEGDGMTLVRVGAGGVAGRGPIIANVGATNGVMRLNYVFRQSALPDVKFYTPNQ